MITSMLYIIVGVVIGFLIKHELEIRTKKKRLAKKVTYLSSTAKIDSRIKKCDDILSSIRSINKNLMSIHNKEKEVR